MGHIPQPPSVKWVWQQLRHDPRIPGDSELELSNKSQDRVPNPLASSCCVCKRNQGHPTGLQGAWMFLNLPAWHSHPLSTRGAVMGETGRGHLATEMPPARGLGQPFRTQVIGRSSLG